MSHYKISRRLSTLALAVCLVVAVLLPYGVGEYWVRLMSAALIAAAAVLGLNFVLGYTGQISLMHASTVGMGAYVLGVGTAKFGMDPWVAAGLGVCAAGAFSYLTGIVLLRLKGHYFALATLGINVSFSIIVSNLVDLTGGSNGISGIPAASIFGLVIDTERKFYYFGLVVVAALSAFAFYVRQSQLGRAMIAVRDDELAASVSGLNLTKVKVTALTLGGIYAGIAGAMFAFHAHFVAPEDFNISQSIIYLAMLVVGGEATILGSILGAIVITFLPEWLRWVGSAYLMVFGLIVVGMLFVAPQGLAGLFRLACERWNPRAMSKGGTGWPFSKSSQ